MRSLSISAGRFFSSARSGVPGAYDLIGSLTAAGGREDAVSAHAGDSRVGRRASGVDAVRGARLGRGGAVDRARRDRRSRTSSRFGSASDGPAVGEDRARSSSSSASRAFLAGERRVARRRRARPRLGDAVPARECATPCAVPRGEVVTLRRAGGARRATRARRVRSGRFCADEPLHVPRPVPPGRRPPTGSGATAPPASGSSGACSRSKASRCDDVGGRPGGACAIAPGASATGSPSCPRSFTRPAACTSGEGRVGAPSRPRERGGGAARVRAAPRRRDPLRDPHVSPPRVRHGDALPAPRRGLRRRSAGARRGRRPRPAGMAARASAAARRRAQPAAARRISAARFSAAGRSRVGRSPHLELRTASARVGGAARAISRTPRARARRGRAREPMPSRTRRAGTRSSRVLALDGRRPRRCSRSRSVRWWPRRARHANRLANADHANLVRTSRAAQPPARGGRAAARRGRARRLPGAAARGGRAPPAPPDGRRCASSPARSRSARRARRRCIGACARLEELAEGTRLDSAATGHRETEERWEFASASTGSAASGGTSSGRSTRSGRTSRSSR